jgi:hypothetical protein
LGDRQWRWLKIIAELVHDEPFEVPDGNRPIAIRPSTRGFTWGITDPAAN